MKVFVIVFSSIVVLMMLLGVIELKLLKVTEYDIKDDNVPGSLKGKKIAVVSDLHGVYHGKENIRLLDKLKRINADYIVVPGDVINGRKDKELKYAEHILKNLSELGSKVFYTFGNHEEKLMINMEDRAAYEKLSEIADKYTVLLNEASFCSEDDERVCFIGLNLPLWIYHDHDRTGMIKGKISEILNERKVLPDYKILIAHDPEHYEKYEEAGIDLAICGHLHGGIVRVPFLGGLVTPRLQIFKDISKGCFKKNNMNLIVSGGVGWHDFPIRIFNRPEIVVIKF